MKSSELISKKSSNHHKKKHKKDKKLKKKLKKEVLTQLVPWHDEVVDTAIEEKSKLLFKGF